MEYYWRWKNWNFGKVRRMNGSLMWGWNPYTSYYIGPLEIRRYDGQ